MYLQERMVNIPVEGKFGEMIMASDSADGMRENFYLKTLLLGERGVKWRDIYCVVRDEKEIREN